MSEAFELFLVTAPGMENALRDEASAAGFAVTATSPGGVGLTGTRDDVMRANLTLRGATRVLMRIGSFRAFHLAQLDKRARKFDWTRFIRTDVPVRVEATCKRSKIYHDRAAAQRIEHAIVEELGGTVDPKAALRLMVRIDDNLVTLSLDTSGESLHKRGHKQAMGKAPLRETLAAGFLRQCGYSGDEPVVDPMCGSGTFVIEAAEIAAGMLPGRARVFAFEQLAGFDSRAWAAMRAVAPGHPTAHRFYGYDRDQGAVGMSTANAERAGVSELTRFQCQPISALTAPEGVRGLVIVNPPYGARIGNKKLLYGLYASLGQRLREGFSGWRVGLVTSETGLAKATGLPFLPPGPPVAHGGLKVRLFQTEKLP